MLKMVEQFAAVLKAVHPSMTQSVDRMTSRIQMSAC